MDKKIKSIMRPWQKDLVYNIDKKVIIPAIIYKSDQTGLFYQLFSNTFYVKKFQKKTYKGSNKVGDKNWVNVMV